MFWLQININGKKRRKKQQPCNHHIFNFVCAKSIRTNMALLSGTHWLLYLNMYCEINN